MMVLLYFRMGMVCLACGKNFNFRPVIAEVEIGWILDGYSKF